MLSLSLALFLAAGPVTEEWAILTSTGPIGTLKAVTTGNTVDIDFRIDNNGRGPKITERVTTDAKGRIVVRDISGTGEVGAAVKEHFEWANGTAKWETLNDRGEAKTDNPFYLDVNGSPWIAGQAVKALMKAKGGSLAVQPAGSMSARKLKDVDLGAAKASDKVSIWLLSTGFEPSQILMRGERFVGAISPGFALMEKKYAGEFAKLSKLATDVESELKIADAKRLTHPLPDAPLWITNVKVFDSASGKMTGPTNVAVYRGIITAVQVEPPPAGALVVDGAQGTLLPGLFDAHTHQSALDGILSIASGVTFVRDPGNDNTSLLTLERHFDRGELIGPHIFKSGFLEGKSPFSASGGFTIATLEEGVAKVRWYAEHGFWGLKIYNSMSPDLVKPLAAEAHKVGLHVSGHVPAFMTSERAVKDGYDEINHINQLMLGFLLKEGEDTRTPFRFTALGDRMAGFDIKGPAFTKMIALMKEKKTTIDPTMAIFSSLLRRRDGTGNPADEGMVDHLPPTVRRGRIGAELALKPEQDPVWFASWKKLEQTLVLLDASGIPLVPGTDDIGGLTLHNELVTWVKAGLSPSTVLKAATSGGATLLGQEAHLGSIAVGRKADLYLVDGDPTQDITTIRKGRLVIKGERAYYPDEIHQTLNVVPFAAHVEVPQAR
jgi:hypothetical protein